MDIKIKIDVDNAAFEGYNGTSEVARILRCAAQMFEDYNDAVEKENYVGFNLKDINGNTVGKVVIED